MTFLKLDRYNQSKKLYAITILDMRIDWRRWYQFWLEKGEDLFNKEHIGWSDVWLSEGELHDDLWYDRVENGDPTRGYFDYIKRDTPHDWKYRKIPLILTICRWNSLWSSRNRRFYLGVIIGILISLIIK